MFMKNLMRWLNPRYAWIAKGLFREPIRILDAGAGPADARIAKRLFPRCYFAAVNIAPLNEEQLKEFDAYHQIDLNTSDLAFLPDEGFDYVISSHTIEHLEDGRKTVAKLCDKVRHGGRLYLEWPSLESKNFPLRGFGLNFFDDPTHLRTFPINEISEIVISHGFSIDYVGYRRMWLRALLSPALVILHSIQNREIVLFDFWDITGFCYVLRGTKGT